MDRFKRRLIRRQEREASRQEPQYTMNDMAAMASYCEELLRNLKRAKSPTFHIFMFGLCITKRDLQEIEGILAEKGYEIYWKQPLGGLRGVYGVMRFKGEEVNSWRNLPLVVRRKGDNKAIPIHCVRELRPNLNGEKMNDKINSVLPVCAVRYALGRQSYMPSVVIDEIMPLLPEMSDGDLQVMRNDISDYLTHENESSIEYKLWSDLYNKIICEQEKR